MAPHLIGGMRDASVRILLQAAILLHGDAGAAAGTGGLIPKICCNLK